MGLRHPFTLDDVSTRLLPCARLLPKKRSDFARTSRGPPRHWVNRGATFSSAPRSASVEASNEFASLGCLPPMARMPLTGSGFLASLGRVGLCVDGHHTRRCGRGWLWPVPLPFRFGDALARSQKCQGNDFGIFSTESQQLRSAELAAYRGLDPRAHRLYLPRLYAGLHTGAKAIAQTTHLDISPSSRSPIADG